MEKDLDLEGEEGWLRVQHLLTDRLITITKNSLQFIYIEKIFWEVEGFIYFLRIYFVFNRSG